MAKQLFTEENAKEKGRKGGIKSGETRRKQAELRDIAKTLIRLGVKSGKFDEIESLEDAKGKNLTIAETIYITQALKAIRGDTKSAIFCFDYADMKPNAKLDIVADVNETNDELSNILSVLTDYQNEKKKGN